MPAIMTFIAGYMVMDEDPVPHLEILDFASHLDNFACYFVAQPWGCNEPSMHLLYISAANAAGPHLNEDLPRGDLGDGNLIHPHIIRPM
jgi:hypothetical protein